MTEKTTADPGAVGSQVQRPVRPLPAPDVPLVRGGCYTAELVRQIVAYEVAAERERAVLAVTAVRIAAECIRAVYSEDWAAFDRLSDEFDNAVSAVGETCGPNAELSRARDADGH